MNEVFLHKRAVIVTQHKKEQVIAPKLEALGLQVQVVTEIDTDVFGTFTREIKRDGDMLQAARKKIAAAKQIIPDADYYLASEGSFGMHAAIPFLITDFELILFEDVKQRCEYRGHYTTPKTNFSSMTISNMKEGLAFAEQVGFPEHGVIVRKNATSTRHIYKDIRTQDQLEEAMTRLLNRPFAKSCFIETDMRANRNPQRMEAIGHATDDLIRQLRNE